MCSMLPNHILNRIIGLQEDERREYYRHFNMEWRIMREDSDPFTLSNSLFKDLFRLNKEMVHFLLLNFPNESFIFLQLDHTREQLVRVGTSHYLNRVCRDVLKKLAISL
ncbi:hypothetical protein NQ314_006921 [Rhamnusium bicolor]|uniref:Maturase K n=1 Tax=Rhamnusium bicolor TaxID=1586634 RepID=A0AAV8YVP1_9CUCU|nr:hypothetical protein NQ314_006921 [Rhamnusium bicolor]